MTAAFHCLLTESVSLRPAPPRCACVRCARNGRPADVSALPCQDVLRAHHALLPARARIPSSASVCCARGSRFEGGTRTSAHVSAHPSFVLRDIRRALRGRHSSVSAQPCRGVRGAKNVLRARDRHPPPRSQRLRRRRFAPPTKFGSSLSPLSHSFAPSGMERGIRSDPVKK